MVLLKAFCISSICLRYLDKDHFTKLRKRYFIISLSARPTQVNAVFKVFQLEYRQLWHIHSIHRHLNIFIDLIRQKDQTSDSSFFSFGM